MKTNHCQAKIKEQNVRISDIHIIVKVKETGMVFIDDIFISV